MNQFYITLLNLALMASRLIKGGSRICFYVANMSPGQYSEIMKMLVWDQLEGVSLYIDEIMDLLKEENMTHNFNLSQLETHVKEVE